MQFGLTYGCPDRARLSLLLLVLERGGDDAGTYQSQESNMSSELSSAMTLQFSFRKTV
jgi:hypothetical protein